MRILDCHVHWFPRSVFEDLCQRKGTYPRAERNSVGGYDLYATYGRVGVVGYRRNAFVREFWKFVDIDLDVQQKAEPK